MIELDAPLDPKKSRLQTQLTASRSILGQTDTVRAKNIRQLWTNFIEAAKSFAPHPNPRGLGPVATICCLCRTWHEVFDIDRLNPHLRAILKPRGLRVRTDPGCKYTRWEEDKVRWLAYGRHILLQLDNSDALDRYLDDIEDRIKAFPQWSKELVAKPKATRLTVSVGGRADHQDMPRNGLILREVRNKKGVKVEELVRIVGKTWTVLFPDRKRRRR